MKIIKTLDGQAKINTGGQTICLLLAILTLGLVLQIPRNLPSHRSSTAYDDQRIAIIAVDMYDNQVRP